MYRTVPCLIVSIVWSTSLFPNPIFSNSQFQISRVTLEDRAAFISVMGNKAVVEQAAGKANPELDRKMAADWFDGIFVTGETGFPWSYGFKISTPDGKPAGFIVLDAYSPEGYWESSTGIHPNYQGQGLGPKARKEVLKYAFEQLQVEGVVCRVRKGNERSVYITEQLGFNRIGETSKEGDASPGMWWEYRINRTSYYKQLGVSFLCANILKK